MGLFKHFGFALFTSLLLSGCSALVTPDKTDQIGALKPGTYQIDPQHSTLLFKIEHLGLSTYVGRFNDFGASLEFDPANIEATRLSARVDTASVDVDDSIIEGTLQNSDWFHSEQFPQAAFTSTAIKPLGDNRFIFTGDLTLRGVTKSVSFQGRFNGGATNLLTRRYTLGFAASGTINRTDFGVDRYTGLVGEEVKLEFYAEFQRQSPSD
ncbi:YceI family protein [Pontibacterium granulatum]|uniref:YceI family protein n=1 Tax=Pontibacterium granulatum TaxID=2036029 RepID=UPI002499AE7F|nr:YceI family protein [Pontibacterium granulatum]MDI3323121.1 YceI family protein [Pontibacterium granulatum]